MKHVVNIIQDANGELAYEDAQGNPIFSTKAKRKDKIEFNCQIGPYAIVFGGSTPFAQAAYTDVVGSSKTVTVKDKATSGAYKYSVIVGLGNALLVDDPEIWID